MSNKSVQAVYVKMFSWLRDMSEAEVDLIARAYHVDHFGPLHIVVEDFNVEDSHIQFCLALPDISPAETSWASELLKHPIKRRKLIVERAAKL